MAGPSWLVDPNRLASKIRSASSRYDPQKVNWNSNPTKACPNCQFTIDNSDVSHEWPGLPSGVKFDPSDQEIIAHLIAKVGIEKTKPHPFIDEFIPTLEEEDGICYTHPQNLPGAKQDGRVSHFFHRAIKAYNTGTRKRRKIHGDVRWHKTGRTKPVFSDGVQKGCKKIMVLYISSLRGGKAEKTNWVMHQYHLGSGEDEKEGEYVVSKVFYQQMQGKQSDKIEDFGKMDPVTPKLANPEPSSVERSFSIDESGIDSTLPLIQEVCMEDGAETPLEHPKEASVDQEGDEALEEVEEGKWWENESPYLLNSQQLVEGLSICEELLQSQSPNRDDDTMQRPRSNPRLSDYARLGPEDLKRDLEDCQTLSSDPANIFLDTPPDFRLSQLEFESQDSFIAWGGSTQGGGKC